MCQGNKIVMKLNTNLSVGYSQIYVEEYCCDFHAHAEAWNDEEMSSMLCVGKSFMIIGTVQRIQAPFSIEILRDKPPLNLDEWNHVNECSIEVESGLLVSGDFDTEGEMIRIDLEKGIYQAFVCYAGLGVVSRDELDGEESYHVLLWPASTHVPKRVLKQWRE